MLSIRLTLERLNPTLMNSTAGGLGSSSSKLVGFALGGWLLVLLNQFLRFVNLLRFFFEIIEIIFVCFMSHSHLVGAQLLHTQKWHQPGASGNSTPMMKSGDMFGVADRCRWDPENGTTNVLLTTCTGNTWWRHLMEAFSTLLAFCEWKPPVTGGFPLTKASDAELGCFLWSAIEKKRLSKESGHWWFETPSCSLWHHCNDSNLVNGNIL